MTISKKMTLPIIFFCLTNTITTLSMNNTETIPSVNCSLKISQHHLYNKSAEYLPKKDHEDLLKENKIESSLKDPMLYVKLKTLEKNNHNVFGSSYMHLPARLFSDLNDQSKLQLYFNNGADFTFKDNPVLINATCIKNKKINGKDFAEQFNNIMNQFYKVPNSFNLFANKEEFLAAGIIKMQEKIISKNISYIMIFHGPNGISSKEKFIELIEETK